MPALACFVDTEFGSRDFANNINVAIENVESPQLWSPSQSASLYKIDRWGAPYFSVNSAGNIAVRPHGSETLTHQEIDLMKVVNKVLGSKTMGGLGLNLPLIVRFPDVLKNRLESLQSAFDSAIQSQGYESHYQGVYPVKCNQDGFIVEDVVKFGYPFRFGLEAGSKPELLLAMSSLCKGNPEALLVCNGYKDVEYISLVLVGRKLGFNTVIVLEQEEELDLVIDVSRRLDVSPVVGLRAKLRTKHEGHFGSTSGEKGKFGLTTIEILSVAKKLKQAGMLDCLQLLHFHIGSQIPSTSLLSDAVGEAAQIYCELVRLGAAMRVIDVGGGLGIDYEGSQSAYSDNSVGYGLREYASAVVQAIRQACDQKFVRHPVICSESGRALVSHHSILIFEALSAVGLETPDLGLHYFLDELTGDARSDYLNLTAAASRGEHEAFSFYVNQFKQCCIEKFKEGSLGLEHLAAADSVCELVAKAMGASDSVQTYHVNLSIFTSVPDSWGIGQQFPIVPIHRLDQQPRVKGILSDLTCDSDGKIDKFINGESSLLLHEFESKDNFGGYYLGMFLGGAYQEALGGLHNLFGRPNVVRVSHSDGHSFSVTKMVPGLSCGEVLKLMQHEPELMFKELKHRVEEHCGLDIEGQIDSSSIVTGLAHSFMNMPYLVTGSVCEISHCNEDGRHNDVAIIGGDNEQWTYCCA
ncbi:hypothetical protein Syun_005297 [Stephania yunnanensis]|uniref:Arginine decarboxylase n=1 Tax=Stephania yunnanensis TaxID=152371 RepID=A0AAP0Q261_9MAGN